MAGYPRNLGDLSNRSLLPARAHTVAMTTTWALNRSLEKIGLLCSAPLDDHALRSAVLVEVGKISPFTAFAWPLSDPETATGTSPMARIPCPEELPLLIRLKYLTPVGRWTSMIGKRQPATTLRMATGGDPTRSLLWDGLLRRYEVTDVLSTVLPTGTAAGGGLTCGAAGERASSLQRRPATLDQSRTS